MASSSSSGVVGLCRVDGGGVVPSFGGARAGRGGGVGSIVVVGLRGVLVVVLVWWLGSV